MLALKLQQMKDDFLWQWAVIVVISSATPCLHFRG